MWVSYMVVVVVVVFAMHMHAYLRVYRQQQKQQPGCSLRSGMQEIAVPRNGMANMEGITYSTPEQSRLRGTQIPLEMGAQARVFALTVFSSKYRWFGCLHK